MTTTSDLAASVLMVLCGRVYVTHMRQDVLTCSLPTERRLLPLFADGRPAAGRTYLAHKAEHAVDLETGAIVGITVQDADEGDTTTSIETLIEAAEQVEAVRPDGQGIEDVVGDKGYHSNQSLVDLEAVGICGYIAERIVDGGTGGRTRPPATAWTAIVGASAAHADCGCCACAASAWNATSPISMRPVGCVACGGIRGPYYDHDSPTNTELRLGGR